MKFISLQLKTLAQFSSITWKYTDVPTKSMSQDQGNQEDRIRCASNESIQNRCLRHIQNDINS